MTVRGRCSGTGFLEGYGRMHSFRHYAVLLLLVPVAFGTLLRDQGRVTHKNNYINSSPLRHHHINLPSIQVPSRVAGFWIAHTGPCSVRAYLTGVREDADESGWGGRG